MKNKSITAACDAIDINRAFHQSEKNFETLFDENKRRLTN